MFICWAQSSPPSPPVVGLQGEEMCCATLWGELTGIQRGENQNLTFHSCVSLGDFCVVEALKQDSWRISNLPMKDDRTIANLIMEDCSELKRLKGKRDRKTDAAEEARVKFRENMSGVLNAAHHKLLAHRRHPPLSVLLGWAKDLASHGPAQTGGGGLLYLPLRW